MEEKIERSWAAVNFSKLQALNFSKKHRTRAKILGDCDFVGERVDFIG